jgi:hypothetical protein
MLALPQVREKVAKAPGRPAVAEPRSCVAAIRLTPSEYDGLIQLAGTGSVSDLGRELLSEALLARSLRSQRSGLSV